MLRLIVISRAWHAMGHAKQSANGGGGTSNTDLDSKNAALPPPPKTHDAEVYRLRLDRSRVVIGGAHGKQGIRRPPLLPRLPDGLRVLEQVIELERRFFRFE